jgi:all-trans-8'-apo-beta-carotenal 15,15'-oxygenase
MKTALTAPLPSAPDWHGGFQDLPREHGFEPLRLEGRLPLDLKGTLYRNGPALYLAQGLRYRHWFDGDGAITAVQFGGGEARGATRVTQSVGLKAERAARRPLHASYGTLPGRMRFWRDGKNTANTSVMFHQGKLYALMEGGLPTEISTEDLHTLGESDFEGLLTRAFTAHPHRVPGRRASYGFSLQYGRKTVLEVFELPENGSARVLTHIPLPRPTMLHDFIATPRHLVFFVSPLRVRLFGLLLGLKSFSDSLDYCSEFGTEVIVVPLNAPEEVKRFTAEAFYQWHFVNAFERDDGIVVDFIRYPDFSSNQHFGRWAMGQLASKGLEGNHHRVVLKPSSGSLELEQSSPRPCEFPQVSPWKLGQEQRYSYLATWSGGDTRGVPDALAKLEVSTGQWSDFAIDRHQYPSEPIFVPRPRAKAEDDGYLLTLVFDPAEKVSFVAIYDAARPGDAALARTYFDHSIPFTFHGLWAPG